MSRKIENGLMTNDSVDDNIAVSSVSMLKKSVNSLVTACEHSMTMMNGICGTDYVCEVPIYYISDIHLEEQGDLKDKSFPQIYDWLLLKCRNLVKCLPGQKGIILIGGDIANDRRLVHAFLYVLHELMIEITTTMPIFYVLGNHELWCGEDEHIPCQEIFKLYEEDNSSLATLLENALYYRYKGLSWSHRVLKEEELISMSEADLKELCDSSSCLIFGGLGFTGNNPWYNARGGVYQSVVSESEDVARTERFRDTYNKLLRCAGDKCVLVLTHTPVQDWSDDQYSTNWIYINGHTHQNRISKTHNGARVLSDAQIGYNPKPWKFKCLSIEGEYDPFEKWSDGIYKISNEQYVEFYRGRNVHIICNRPDQIYMLKRNNKYMFLQQGKRLYVLSGGKQCVADFEISYYFENMLEYANRLAQLYLPLKNILDQISREVRLFGGHGTIHGCIVDIDHYMHIYLNPFDGSLVPYYALNPDFKTAYKSTEKLLEAYSGRYGLAAKSYTKMLKQYTALKKKKKLPLISGRKKCSGSGSSSTQLVTSRAMYSPSAKIYELQYLIDKNVIRHWQDDIIRHNLNINCALSRNTKN